MDTSISTTSMKQLFAILFFLGLTAFQQVKAQSVDTMIVAEDTMKSVIDEVTIQAEKMKEIRLKSVEGTVIFEGKKTEIVDLNNLQANTATNNGRQIFNRIAGLNVWENDAAGMQLGIGARGLNPNRSAAV